MRRAHTSCEASWGAHYGTRSPAFEAGGCGGGGRQRDGCEQATACDAISVEPSIARCGREDRRTPFPALEQAHGPDRGRRTVAAIGAECFGRARAHAAR